MFLLFLLTLFLSCHAVHRLSIFARNHCEHHYHRQRIDVNLRVSTWAARELKYDGGGGGGGGHKRKKRKKEWRVTDGPLQRDIGPPSPQTTTCKSTVSGRTSGPSEAQTNENEASLICICFFC